MYLAYFAVPLFCGRISVTHTMEPSVFLVKSLHGTSLVSPHVRHFINIGSHIGSPKPPTHSRSMW